MNLLKLVANIFKYSVLLRVRLWNSGQYSLYLFAEYVCYVCPDFEGIRVLFLGPQHSTGVPVAQLGL